MKQPSSSMREKHTDLIFDNKKNKTKQENLPLGCLQLDLFPKQKLLAPV